jgi:hypothetical protein
MGSRRAAHFRNGQWEVTNYGVASLRIGAPYRFQIDAEDLIATDTFGGQRLYVWPLHVLQKSWVKSNLFFEAFKFAIEVHEGKYPGQVDNELLNTSFSEALRQQQVRVWRPSRGAGSLLGSSVTLPPPLVKPTTRLTR